MQTPYLIFRGDPQRPFLSPRGIDVAGNRLLISDTASNQVWIWNSLPEREFQAPDILLGNGNATPCAASFYYPSGVWSNGEKLIVADAWNHRVLIWHSFPKQHFTPADVVLGQANFSENLPNIHGLNSPPTAQSLYWCYGVYSDGKALWIADTGNRRVLYFDHIPLRSFASADGVIGQPHVHTRDFSPTFATWPYSVKLSSKGELLISDTQCFRVLYWKKWQNALTHPAEVVFGQPDPLANGQNNYRLKPSASSLNWCYDAIFAPSEKHIFIADTGNSRILQFEHPPLHHAPIAQSVYGQKGMEELGENKESMMGVEGYLYWPFGIATQGNQLFVCETGNHKINIYTI